MLLADRICLNGILAAYMSFDHLDVKVFVSAAQTQLHLLGVQVEEFVPLVHLIHVCSGQVKLRRTASDEDFSVVHEKLLLEVLKVRNVHPPVLKPAPLLPAVVEQAGTEGAQLRVIGQELLAGVGGQRDDHSRVERELDLPVQEAALRLLLGWVKLARKAEQVTFAQRVYGNFDPVHFVVGNFNPIHLVLLDHLV